MTYTARVWSTHNKLQREKKHIKSKKMCSPRILSLLNMSMLICKPNDNKFCCFSHFYMEGFRDPWQTEKTDWLNSLTLQFIIKNKCTSKARNKILILYFPKSWTVLMIKFSCSQAESQMMVCYSPVSQQMPQRTAPVIKSLMSNIS